LLYGVLWVIIIINYCSTNVSSLFLLLYESEYLFTRLTRKFIADLLCSYVWHEPL
jgi:hypothetical protein